MYKICYLCFFFSFLASSCKKDIQEDSSRPNIIVILTDDQRWDALGYAGNNIIQTPELDRLAQEGTYFKKAFVTTPICATSRASVLTGLHERTHNYTFQRGNLKQAYMDMSYPLKLKEAGYYTGFFGKFGVNYPDAEQLFDAAEIYDRNGKYPNYKGYFYKTIATDTVHLTRYTGHLAKGFIDSIPDNQPFCLSLSFSAPHAHDNAPEQYFWQEKSNERYADYQFAPPSLSSDQDFLTLPEEVRAGFNRTRWHWRFDTPEKYQHNLTGYYRMISEIDDEIGLLREELQAKGLAENTVILLMGDNGYFLGERQLAGKWLMYDHSIRVPLIIYDPRADIHFDIEDMVVNLDLTSTILDVAGVKPPPNYQGISLMPYVTRGSHSSPRETILIEHLWELPQIPSSEGIRSDKWKYFQYRFIDAPEELYDLEKDPMEIKNLAENPKYAPVLNIFRKELEYRTKQYQDAKIVSDFVQPKDLNMGF